jgi:hypothetical protein
LGNVVENKKFRTYVQTKDHYEDAKRFISDLYQLTQQREEMVKTVGADSRSYTIKLPTARIFSLE